jgi:hypothetical protein
MNNYVCRVAAAHGTASVMVAVLRHDHLLVRKTD